MNSASIIAFQTVVMFILLFVGYFLYKKKLLSEESTKQLSNITLSVINPLVIFNAYQMDFDPEMVKGLLYSVLLALAAHAVLIAAAAAIIRRGGKNFEIERFAMAYSNCAFMGIPLVQSTFGSEGVFYLTGYITVFNLLMWTHGNLSMAGGEKTSLKETAKSVLKVMTSPAILSIAVGLVFFFTGLRLPSVIQQPVDYLSSLNTPLAMLVSGATIAKAGLLGAFKQKRVYLVQLFKLIAVPFVLCGLFVPLQLAGVDIMIINTVLIATSAPTASATIMFSYRHGKDAEYASNHFAVSTIASMATMPLVLLFADVVSGLIA